MKKIFLGQFHKQTNSIYKKIVMLNIHLKDQHLINFQNVLIDQVQDLKHFNLKEGKQQDSKLKELSKRKEIIKS